MERNNNAYGIQLSRKQDFELMLESSRREAVKHFADDKVLVEKYLVRPR